MPDLDLDAIRARADAATPGPWRVVVDDSECPRTVWRECTSPDHPTDQDPGRDYVYDDCRAGELHGDPFFCEVDAAFIAHARTDVPALLAEVERLRTDLATMTYNATGWMDEARRQAAERDKNGAEVKRLRDELDQTRADAAPLRVLRDWLDTYPALPDDVTGDPELMAVATVQHILAGGALRFVEQVPASNEP